MLKGYILNNTGKSRYIFKKTVYPGQSLDLGYVYDLLQSKLPEGEQFVKWLRKEYLPKGWEIAVTATESTRTASESASRPFREELVATPTVQSSDSMDSESMGRENGKVEDEDDSRPSLEFLTPSAVRRMSAKDIYNLRIKDNPRRVLSFVDSIHKLRRAITLCNADPRKSMLTRSIQHRIKEIMRE